MTNHRSGDLWCFPEIDCLKIDTENGVIAETITLENKSDDLLMAQNEIIRLNNLISEMQLKYENQIDTLNKLFTQLNELMPSINEEVTKKIINIINSASSLVIKKEIYNDPAIVSKLMQELMSELKNESIISMETSEELYNLLLKNNQPLSINIKINANLHFNEVFISTDISQYIYTIDNKIKKIFMVENE